MTLTFSIWDSLGGLSQTGEWKIDARYNKEDLISRIRKIARYKSRIHLYNENAYDFLKDVSPALADKALIYLDPPYYNKGQELYENHYKHEDHVLIAELVAKNIDQNWLITYDNLPVIQELYSKFRCVTYNISYSASKRYKGSEIMIFCDNLVLPDVKSPACIPSERLKRLLANQGQRCLPL
jgi:DNA adenine methylase